MSTQVSIARAILNGDSTKDGSVAILSSRTTVGRLRAARPRFSDLDQRVLQNFSCIRCGYGITDFELYFLSKQFSCISRIILSNSEYLTGKGLSCLKRLRNLEKLEIIECNNLRNQGLEDLSELRIKSIQLRSLKWLTSKGVQFLNPSRLEVLEITDCPKICDSSLVVLRGWPIRKLTLNADCLTEVGISHISQLPNLKELVLIGTPPEYMGTNERLDLMEKLQLDQLVFSDL